MKETELNSVQAARWVWESLWSSRRHARVDILDVALFDDPVDGVKLSSTTSSIMRWLFTAKDGRIMKKSWDKASLRALKQALLGRVLHGASEDSMDSSVVGKVAEPIFATALLRSGKSVPLDEDAWAALVVGRGEPDGVTAVTALIPGDSSEPRRGFGQRVMCEYRVKTDGAMASGADGAFAKPIEASTTTYVLVSSGLLRQREDPAVPQVQEDKTLARGTTILEGRLVSRVKATNRQVEAKLRRIVQWVQEARKMHVLSITAMFMVLPSSGAGTPGVWLERALDIRMVPKKATSVVEAAPMADPQQMPRSRRNVLDISRPASLPLTSLDPEGVKCPNLLELSGGVAIHQEGDNLKNIQPEAVVAMSSEQAASTVGPASESSSASTPATSCVALPETKTPSTAVMLSAVSDAVLSLGKHAPSQAGGDNDGVEHVAIGDDRNSMAETAAAWRQRGRAIVASEDCQYAAAAREKCVGDFCTYHGQSVLPPPSQKVNEDSTTGETELDWTDVNMSNRSSTLLEVAKQGASVEPVKGDMLFSLAFKSVGLARMEAKQGYTLYWGEILRRCWREGGCRGGGLEELGPAAMYKEVVVCRTCYDVYRHLDKLREQLDDTGARRSSGSNVLAKVDATAASGRRAAAAEVGAANLRADVTAMLKDVDARTGRLGIEAGIIWRRRLSKSKSSDGMELVTAQSQALLMDRLARPKPPVLADVDPTPPLDPKRQVKSQGDVPEYAANRYQRRTSAPPGFPLLERRRSLARASWGRVGPTVSAREEDAVARRTLPHGVPRRTAWPLRETTGGSKVVDGHDKGLIAPRYGGKEESFNRGGGPDGSASKATIRAIEAMLEDGSESYLPACARDLPEARAVLGPRSTSPTGMKEGERERHHRAGKRGKQSGCRYIGRESKGGHDLLKLSNGNPTGARKDSIDMDANENAGRKESSRLRKERAEERFLHLWQRTLEANKRAAGKTAEHEAALAREKRRRSNARREAAASEDCRRAGRRVAAHLGRHLRRRSRRNEGNDKRSGRLYRSKRLKQGDSRLHRLRINATGSGSSHSSDLGNVARTSESGNDNVAVDKDCLDQMRDALGWARKTFNALVKRLQDRGVAVQNTTATGGKDEREVRQLVHKLQIRLAAFEDESATMDSKKTAEATAGSTNTLTPLRSKCEAACESFEVDFCRLIDELTLTAKTRLHHAKLPLFGYKDHTNMTYGGGQGQASSWPAASQLASAAVTGIRTSTFGLCPSCSVLPVARRCLDCDGDDLDRDRCAGCFVRGHRDAARHNHRFLRISSGGDVGTGTSGLKHGAEVGEDMTAHATCPDNSRSVRCSRCGDLAASRRCRDCRVDMCAACHFLAHRSPSRQAHVTEFVGETAVAMQEALHQRSTAVTNGGDGVQNKSPVNGVDEAVLFSPPQSPISKYHKEVRGDVGKCMEPKGEGMFDKEAAQSLVQVRRTVDAPVVCPLPPPWPSQERDPLCDSAGRDGLSDELSPVESNKSVKKDSYGGHGGDSGKSRQEPIANETTGDNENSDDEIGEEARGVSGSLEKGQCQKGGRGNIDDERLDEIAEEEEADSNSSSEADTDDEGMMWSPANIAKVNLDASTSDEDETSPAPPVRTPSGETDNIDKTPTISRPSTLADRYDADKSESPQAPAREDMSRALVVYSQDIGKSGEEAESGANTWSNSK